MLVAVVTHTRADPDLFGNVRFGADVVSARSPVVADGYSFTGAGTFVNHEWLSEALMFIAFDAAGGTGLIVLKLALVGLMFVAVVLALKGCDAAVVDLLLAIVAVTTFPQTNHIRAQLFSLALFACVLLTLASGEKLRARLWWLVPIMAVWPNLHGGWIVAAGTLGIWSAAGLATAPRSRESWYVAAVAAAALAATMLNPWGWRMWAFLFETVGLDRADIRDWQPPFRLGAAYGALWLIVAITASAALIGRLRSKDLARVAVVILLGVASFRVNRLTAFFALATVMLLGSRLADLLVSLRSGHQRESTRTAAAAAAVLALAMIAGAATVSARNLSCISMEAPLFPEREVASLVARYGLHGRLLNWFDYGHYAIWHLSPAMKVSIDGRRETVYSRETIQRHLAFYFAPEQRQNAIDALAPDYIWIPSNLDVTARLIADGWKPFFRGPESTLLANPSNPENLANLTNPANLANLVPRCFPGP